MMVKEREISDQESISETSREADEYSVEDDDEEDLQAPAQENSSIKIFARIRPSNNKKNERYYVQEGSGALPLIGFRVPKDDTQGLINNQKESHEFKFSKIFDQETEQEEIFDTVAKDVCDSVLEGYNGSS